MNGSNGDKLKKKKMKNKIRKKEERDEKKQEEVKEKTNCPWKKNVNWFLLHQMIKK